jgi:hypothetical protein
MNEDERLQAETEPEREDPGLPDYEPPRVVTHRGQEILEALGPAQACSFNHSVLLCP